jgi:hypothetical protein
VAAAARMNTGDRRDEDVGHKRLHGVVVELRGDDVVLARELWWRGKARSELSTRSRRRRRTVAVGEDASVEIGKWLGLGSTSGGRESLRRS